MKAVSTQKSRGYSLIELVAVTLSSGVLAASALPHFIDLRDEARQVAFRGLERSIQQAAHMAHGQQRLQGLAPDQAIVVNGQRIGMQRGFPSKAALGLLVNNPDFTYHPQQGWFVWRHSGNAQCRQSYLPAEGSEALPKVRRVERGC